MRARWPQWRGRDRHPSRMRTGSRCGSGQGCFGGKPGGRAGVGSPARPRGCLDLQEDSRLQLGSRGSSWMCFKRGSLRGSTTDGVVRGSLAAEQRGGEEPSGHLEMLAGSYCHLNKGRWLRGTRVWPGQVSGWIGGEGWTGQRVESGGIQMMGPSTEKSGKRLIVTQPPGRGAKPQAQGL